MVVSSQKLLGVLKRSLTPNRPYHVQWLLTRRCNYRCKSCEVWTEQQHLEEVSTEEVKRGLDVLRKLGVVEIVLSGGNPLLRHDIKEIIDYASRFFVTTVYDNGSMAIEKIDALRSADFVAISLDTLDEEKFDYIRGVRGAWKTAMQAIETLHEEGIQVRVSPTISQLNLYEIIDFTKHFIDRGIPVWYCLYSYDSPTGNSLFTIGKKRDEFEIVDREAMAKVCDTLLEMKKKHEGIYITTKTLLALKHLFQNNQRTWKCKALQGFFMIDHLGRVAGCHRNEPVASIFELLEIWDSERFQSLRQKYSECTQCAYLCYIFYSIHSDVKGNLGILRDQWKNIKQLIGEKRNLKVNNQH